MQSRIAPPLRLGSPLSPATPGPRAARFGRDGARGCRFVELPLIACRRKGWGWLSLSAWASRLAARQPRRGWPRGAGAATGEPSPMAAAVHSLALWAARLSTGGRGKNGTPCRPMGCKSPPHFLANRACADADHTSTPLISAPSVPISSRRNPMSVPCPRSMSDKGGLADFGCQFRHAQTWRIGTQRQSAPHPSGVGMHRVPGVVLSRCRTALKSIQ